MERLADDEGTVHTQRVRAPAEAFQLRGHRLLELQQAEDRNVHVRRAARSSRRASELELRGFM